MDGLSDTPGPAPGPLSAARPSRALLAAWRRGRVARRGVLPAFRLSLGFTLFYLSLLVLLPLGTLFGKVLGVNWRHIVAELTSERVVAAYKLSLGASLTAATINAFFGLLLAWVLVRYRFWGRTLVDALVDLPFALPTAVAGIALTAVYSLNGWLGRFLEPWGLKVAFSRAGVVFAMAFVGLPFVVRTVQPVIEDLDRSAEEAAATLGAGSGRIFLQIVFPQIFPALLTGFTLAFARALGEYGSIVFISGNMPFQTEIVPLLIVTKLEQYDYNGAMVVAVVLLLLSLSLLLFSNFLQWWSRRRLVAGRVGG